ncbi:MAG TPA: bifunctional phosphoribosylaminoimidazolecarboxamide formyltransferase/IMP cyclohydrolase, partial [Alphaproteobacteria bacterium]
MSDDLRAIGRALLSVSDKTGLAAFAGALSARGAALVSTGGSARALREAGLAVTEVAELTGQPEMMGGRVKTLHPLVHGGILARRDLEADCAAMAAHGICAIDLVAVNLYPFERAVAGGADEATCIETIDIGGPALIRSAAKNHAYVTVVTDPADYAAVIDELARHDGKVGGALRRELAARAFARTAAYDAAIAQWFAGQATGGLPARLTVSMPRRQGLRYGENPHQRAAFYVDTSPRPGVATATQLQGKELSYNNIADTDAAYELVAELERPAAAIVKHANPCGVAVGKTSLDAYRRALACDPLSAFGGIVAVNRALDAALARAVCELFTEVVIAPEADAEARAVFAERKNLRLLVAGALPDPQAPALALRSVAGGVLVQDRDARRIGPADLKVVTRRAPDEAEIADLTFAFTVAKHVKSNAIVYAKGGATVGIGAGQMSRVDAVRLAVAKAGDAARAAGESGRRTDGAAVASDAFFPFTDGLIAAAEAGA